MKSSTYILLSLTALPTCAIALQLPSTPPVVTEYEQCTVLSSQIREIHNQALEQDQACHRNQMQSKAKFEYGLNVPSCIKEASPFKSLTFSACYATRAQFCEIKVHSFSESRKCREAVRKYKDAEQRRRTAEKDRTLDRSSPIPVRSGESSATNTINRVTQLRHTHGIKMADQMYEKHIGGDYAKLLLGIDSGVHFTKSIGAINATNATRIRQSLRQIVKIHRTLVSQMTNAYDNFDASASLAATTTSYTNARSTQSLRFSRIFNPPDTKDPLQETLAKLLLEFESRKTYNSRASEVAMRIATEARQRAAQQRRQREEQERRRIAEAANQRRQMERARIERAQAQQREQELAALRAAEEYRAQQQPTYTYQGPSMLETMTDTLLRIQLERLRQSQRSSSGRARSAPTYTDTCSYQGGQANQSTYGTPVINEGDC